MKDQTDRPNRYLKRREAERFWQFQFERDPIKETETFYDKDHGSKELSLAAARKYRDEFFKAAADIGVIDASGQFYIRPLPIQTVPSLRNKSGIVGVSRDARFNKSKSSFEKVWIANYKNDEGENEQKVLYYYRPRRETGANRGDSIQTHLCAKGTWATELRPAQGASASTH